MRYCFRPLLSVLIVAILALASALSDARASQPAKACERAAVIAAQETGVPADILGALTLTETGRRQDGLVQPWAWSVNAEGSGTWFDDPRRALAFAEARVAEGRTNLDIGCFQINYRWHGDQFDSVAEMFDPLSNARYAARFVAQLHAETGDWRAAAGAFHSRSPAQAQKYLTRFDGLHATLVAQGWGGMTGTDETFNSFAGESSLMADNRVGRADAGGAGGFGMDGFGLEGQGGSRAADPWADPWADPSAGSQDALLLALGVEAPVPDQGRTGGPIDVSLDGDAGALSADGWQPMVLPGEIQPRSRRRPKDPRQPVTMLGSAPYEEERPQRGSLALLGTARGPLLTGGGPILTTAAAQEGLRPDGV